MAASPPIIPTYKIGIVGHTGSSKLEFLARFCGEDLRNGTFIRTQESFVPLSLTFLCSLLINHIIPLFRVFNPYFAFFSSLTSTSFSSFDLLCCRIENFSVWLLIRCFVQKMTVSVDGI